jgi:hypothetical protein
MHWVYVQLDRGFHCVRLSAVRNNAQDFEASEYLFDRHRNRLSWNFINAFEPTLTDLLLATCLIEINNDVWFVSVKVRRWVVECKMPVFTYANKRYINCLLRDEVANPSTFVLDVIDLTIDKMKSARMNAVNDSFVQVVAKARGVRLRQANVLIQMKEGDFRPVDSRLHERVKKLKLRRSGGGDHVSRVTFRDGVIDNGGRVASSSLAKLSLCRKDSYLQTIPPSYARLCHAPVAADLSTASSTR